MPTRVRDVYFAPTLLCGAMILVASVSDRLAGLDSARLYFAYFSASIATTGTCILISIFWWVVQLARVGADAPLRNVVQRLRDRGPYLLLPALVFPLFLASFTATKTAIPFLVGYTWDPFWMRVDRMIFGDDAWRIAYRLFSGRLLVPLGWCYTTGWGLTLILVSALAPLNCSPKFVAKFYSAMMATWLIAGIGLAYLFSAAGPVFTNVHDADGSGHFADLRVFLGSSLGVHSPIKLTQAYLSSAVNSRIAVRGGGISAMPSMHVAVASLYVLAARRTVWFVPSIVFWIIIFISSGYFGYHYWIDGIIAAAAASACWAVFGGLHGRLLFCASSETSVAFGA